MKERNKKLRKKAQKMRTETAAMYLWYMEHIEKEKSHQEKSHQEKT